MVGNLCSPPSIRLENIAGKLTDGYEDATALFAGEEKKSC